MPYDDILLDTEERMEKAVNALKEQFRTIRSGRAQAGLVEQIRVDYYGTLTPLRQMANISVPDPRTIFIRPYDPSVCGEVEKAILKSDLGITPANDGKLLRLSVPPLSEERRKKLVQQIRTHAEESKTAIRNIRRDANKEIDKQKKDGTLTEDEAFDAREEVQELTSKYEKHIDEAVDHKSKEMLEV
jgi:ribosome recycling factor